MTYITFSSIQFWDTTIYLNISIFIEEIYWKDLFSYRINHSHEIAYSDFLMKDKIPLCP